MTHAQIIFLAVVAYIVAVPTIGALRQPRGWRDLGAMEWFFFGVVFPLAGVFFGAACFASWIELDRMA